MAEPAQYGAGLPSLTGQAPAATTQQSAGPYKDTATIQTTNPFQGMTPIVTPLGLIQAGLGMPMPAFNTRLAR